MSKIVGIEDNHAPKDELFRVEWNLENVVIIIVVTVAMNSDNTSDLRLGEIFTNTIDEIKRGTDKKIKISFTGGEHFELSNL